MKFKDFILKLKRFKLFFKITLLLVLGFILFYSNTVKSDNPILKILIILFYYLVLNTSFNIVKSFLLSGYLKKNKFNWDHVDNFTIGIERITFLLVNISFIVFFLNIIGIELKQFLTSISLIAVALVLIFKEYISNILNGLIVMFSNEIRIKEYIKIDDFKGRIINFTFLNTEIKTDDGNVIYIPNSLLVSKEIINYSKSTTKRITLSFSLSQDYYSKVDRLENFIVRVIKKKFEGRGLLLADGIVIKPVEIKKDETTYAIDITVTRYNFKIENEIKHFLSKKIITFLDKERLKNSKK